MLKRLFAFVLCLCLMIGLLPGVEAFGRAPAAPGSVDQCCNTRRASTLAPNYVRPAFEGKLIEITPQRVEDTFAYLNDHYVEKYPEQALAVYTGTEEDRANLKTLALTITEGCSTAKEKADAIDRWLARNIDYDVNTSAYASDTFYRRKGNCLSYANLMMFLLRSLEIPAVVGDGWRGDMKTSTVDLFNMEGHAWCFVLLGDEWVLYDPLWLNCGTTDRDYIAEWIYLDTVEFVTPASDGDKLPPKTSEIPMPFCTDGKYYLYSNAFPTGSGTLSYFVNNQAYIFVTNQCDPDGSQDGRLYYDGRDKSGMVMGELYRDGWVSYGDYHAQKSMAHTYAFPNGMMPDGYTMDFDGIRWYMSYDAAMPILLGEEDYHIQDGLVTLQPGYTGPFLGLPWQEKAIHSDYGTCFVTYSNQNPEVATVDQNGIITCHAEGYAEFEIKLQRQERDGSLTLMGTNHTGIFVSTEDRTPDYTDRKPQTHEHDWKLSRTVEATCEDYGYALYHCAGCGESDEVRTQDPLNHDYSIIQVTAPNCTYGGYTKHTCSRCGDFYTEAPTERNPDKHVWKENTCIHCGYVLEVEFEDVAPGQFYQEPVTWAVQQGVTTGTSTSTFSPDNLCTRGQVVTFLWRAKGEPEPKSTDHPFTDIDPNAFYYKAVLWAVESGVTSGISATEFGPERTCTRAQVVTFLYRAMEKPAVSSTSHPFTDVSSSGFYYLPMLWAVENKVTAGMTETTFVPDNTCTRAQVVTFLFRTLAE